MFYDKKDDWGKFTFLEHLRNIYNGEWEIYWWPTDVDFGVYFTQYDGYWYSLNLKIVSIEVYW